MRWIFITRKLDPTDARAGFVTHWIDGLAARLDHLDVICQEQAAQTLPDHVSLYSMGKESGAGRITQAWRFTQHLRRLAPHADGIFCHMIPRYALFAAPWSRRYHLPLLLWYTHRHASPELRIAARLATRILTASPGSFPVKTEKLAVMGHGIQTDLFPDPTGEQTPPAIVLVARLSRIKRQDWLLRAASRAMQHTGVKDFRVQIVGGSVESEPGYRAELDALVRTLSPAPAVTFTGPLPHAEVAALTRECAIATNLSPPGHFDKTALEGMLAGKPTLVTNTDFLPLLGETADLLYVPETASDDVLAERLARLLGMTPGERGALGLQLRERALRAHSLDGLMDRLVTLMGEAAHRE